MRVERKVSVFQEHPPIEAEIHTKICFCSPSKVRLIIRRLQQNLRRL